MSEREHNGGIIPPHIAGKLRWERDEPETTLKIGGVDLSGHVRNPEADEELAIKKLAGLQDFSLTLDLHPVKWEVPDGKWQAFKHRLKFRWPRLLCWLRVRYITYWSGASVREVGPVVSELEEQ